MPASGNTIDFIFKDGKLFIFESQMVRLVHPWPDKTVSQSPYAIQKHPERRAWVPFEPHFALVKPFRSKKKKEPILPQTPIQLNLFTSQPIQPLKKQQTPRQRKNQAFERLRFSLTKDVARILEPFEQNQWPLLFLLHHSTEAVELATQNPILAYLMAIFCRQKDLSPNQIKSLLAQKQTTILRYLGFTGKTSEIKILRKIIPSSLSVDHSLYLRHLLQNNVAEKILLHLKKVNAGVIALMMNPELLGLVSVEMLQEISEDKREKYYPFTASILTESLQFAKEINQPRTTPFKSMQNFRRWYQEIETDYARQLPERLLQEKLPSPPIAGNQMIIPLLTSQALIEEGRLQKNCVATYIPRVQRRETYIYRVLLPERATLSIVKAHGTWYLGELFLAENEPVSPLTRQAVTRWFEGSIL